MSPTLNLVPDDLHNDTHIRLDEAIISTCLEPSTHIVAALLLVMITRNSEQKLNPRYEVIDEAEDLLTQYPELTEMLKVAWAKKSFKEIRRLEILRPMGDPTRSISRTPLHREEIIRQQKAIKQSWEREFVGDAADALWDHITRHYNSKDINKVYSRYTAIVQSSGMGKSRTVDELSKKCFTIPMNLREPTSTGYPPADHEVRDFLAADLPQNYVYLHMCAFLEALFDQATETIRNEFDNSDLDDLASQFRKKMTDGQTFESANPFRKKFYHEVLQKAKAKFYAAKQHSQTQGDIPVYTSSSRKSKQYDFPPARACEDLIAVLRGEREGTPTLDSTADENERPYVLLSFDEAHTITLTKTTKDTQTSWSNFTELRHVLCGLRYFPIFSLLMSTTGKISLFTPAPGDDHSKRVLLRELILIKPFTVTGFGTLARVISIRDNWTLEEVTNDYHIVRLGRPMFPALWDAGDKAIQQDIILLARAKLLNPDPLGVENLNNNQKLACLSQRLPIEFNSTTYIAQANERKQVEGHMRVCLKIDATFESMVTVPASEPLLSEAAYTVMSHPSFNVPKAMKAVLDGFSINKGDRGEFVVMLLFIAARDKAVGPPDSQGSPTSRILCVAQFLPGCLFRNSTNLHRLTEDSPQSYMHFNHYVKVHEYAGIDAESLLLLSTRGAAVLCATHQQAIDGINPFLYKGTNLRCDNLGLILWQAKNNASYKAEPLPSLFAAMDPYELQILKKGNRPIPLIKIVFALAANIPSLTVVRRPPSLEYNAVVYEIWCAGISPDILGAVEPAQATTWEALVQASYGWKSIYEGTAKEKHLMRSMNPGAAGDVGHWNSWCVRSFN